MKLSHALFDVKVAFLTGVLEDVEIYMNAPEGLENMEGHCVLLLKTIYGLVQSSRGFFLKIITELQKIGFEQSKADPCSMTRRNKKGLVILALYVDDVCTYGHKAALDEAFKQIKKVFTITIMEHLNN